MAWWIQDVGCSAVGPTGSGRPNVVVGFGSAQEIERHRARGDGALDRMLNEEMAEAEARMGRIEERGGGAPADCGPVTAGLMTGGFMRATPGRR